MMKQLVILSGKGGTGKTTVAAALAHLVSQESGELDCFWGERDPFGLDSLVDGEAVVG
jgi:ABC-type dipeptide/oligopeptide/nickel transport system ATPase subunit